MSHQLDRLELEVRTADEALARQLLDRLGRLHRQALEEVLARVLDQLSPRGTRQRLERLELDLGEIPLDQLERQLPERLEKALRQALPPRLRTVRSKPTIPRPHPSDDPPRMPSPQASLPRPLELLACFATTGTLPWWAPRDDARLIPATCAAALRLPPAILSPFLRQLANTPTARGRLLAAVPPAQRRLLQEGLGKATSSHEQPPAEAPSASEAIQHTSPTPTRQPSSNNPDNPISSDRSDQHSHVPSPASSVDSLSPVGFVNPVSSSPSPSPTDDTPRPAGKAPRSLSDAASLSSSRVTPSQPDSTPPTQQPGPNLSSDPSSISSSSTDQPTTPVHAATSPTVGATPARGESSR
ncbi:MAG: contractile injection system tape measure protein, partial [Cyanobacteriota bacterium]|nr:contractile injection system tape measure protein [Cyanobacteriota bacterium]